MTATSVAPALSSTFKEASAEITDNLCPDGQLDFDDDGEACYFGSSSGRVELLHSVGVATDEERLGSPDSRPRFPPNRYSQLVDSATEIPQELQNHLVSLYFEWEQPWFQLVDENLFRHSWQTKGRYFSPLLLNCILALGSRHSDRPEVRSCQDDPNTAGQLFLEAAEVLLQFDLKCPTTTTIQSLAMMAVLYVATGSDPKGWLRHGMAIRLALDMGFNLDSSMLALLGYKDIFEALRRNAVAC
ncbi:hypothetical protein N7490_002374 [Penicillium lividum]|nr:hypothetical protein N7490_002374 [Penicillium lividum]